MKESKFSMNVLLVVVICFSAITFLITIKLMKTAGDTWAINDFYRIEDSEYAVRYSNLEPDGIYKGSENTNELVIEGNYGYDWGAVIEENTLYVNEYDSTDLGLMISNVVKINLDTKEKTVLFRDSALRGKCLSGELVIVDGFSSQSNHPDTNYLCKLYSLSQRIDFDKNSEVIYYDTESSEVALRLKDFSVSEKTFEKNYINISLEEVTG